jgi:hypothetical protein
MVRHINKPHPFQSKQLPIIDIREFPTSNSADSTCFADKSSPIGDVRETESSIVFAASYKRSANSNAGDMICRPTRLHPSALVSKGEASVGEMAAKHAGIIR